MKLEDLIEKVKEEYPNLSMEERCLYMDGYMDGLLDGTKEALVSVEEIIGGTDDLSQNKCTL